VSIFVVFCLDFVVHAERLVLPPGLPFALCSKDPALSLCLYLVAQSAEYAAAIFEQLLSYGIKRK